MDEQIREHERAVRALEEQIREHERAMVKLKRARNSFLNISKLPPEILGNIFHWNVAFKDDFGGLEKGSHNFLSVCYHWSKVASHTPELWSFWGNTLEDWARWYRNSGTAPLDLVLNSIEYDVGDLSAALRNALQDRATADRIRRVHLSAEVLGLLSSIVASLTAECEGIRSNSMESLLLWGCDETLDLSDFFAHYNFRKLRRLDLINCTTSSWDHLTSRTGALTNLELDFAEPKHTPTTSQLLSILASNPALRRLSLFRCAIPDDDGVESSFRVPLHHLKELKLLGYSEDAIGFLYRLDHPANMDRLMLNLEDCTIVEISRTIGPYLRDYLRRRGMSKNGLELFLSSDRGITLKVGDAHGTGPLLQQMDTFMRINLDLEEILRYDVKQKLILDLIAHAPQEEIVYFRSRDDPIAMENVYAQFPNLRTLSLENIPLSSVFPRPNLGGDKGIPLSLQCMFLRELAVHDDDWSSLMTFLARRASTGNCLDALEISCSPRMCPAVVEDISEVVQELKIEDPVINFPACPFGTHS